MYRELYIIMKQNTLLTKAVQEATGQTKAEAEKNIEAVLTSVKSLAEQNGKLTIQSYGTFAVKHKPAGTARNPRTGESVAVPAKDVFTFKGSK